MEKRKIINSVFKSLIFSFFFITVLCIASAVNVKAFNIEGNGSQQMQYYVGSRQNIVFIDDNYDVKEAYFEAVHYKVFKNTTFSSAVNGYIIRDDENVFLSDYGSLLIENYNISYSNADLLFIVTASCDVYQYLCSYEYGNEIFINNETQEIVELDINFDFSSIERNIVFYTHEFDNNDVENKINNAFYFENLNTNFGSNETGSCAYVSLGILLGYYDLFQNNNLIENEGMYYSGKATASSIEGSNTDYFIKEELGTNYNANSFMNSPGSTNAFHNFLVYEIGRKGLGYYNEGTTENSVDGISIGQAANVLGTYLLNCTNLTSNDFNIEMHATQSDIIQALDNNKPVLIACYSWAMNYIINISGKNYDTIDTYLNSGHALVAYGYENVDGKIYYKCHAGYTESGLNNFSESIIVSFDDEEIDGLSLTLNTSHACSNSYVNSTTQKDFCVGCGAIYIDEVSLNCQTEAYTDSKSLQQNQALIYELDLECDTRYDFEVESPNLLSVGLYDENMTLVSDFLYFQGTNNNFYYFNVQDLDEGKYYIKINLASGSSSCNIKVTLDHRPTSPEEILVNEPVDVLEHLHYNNNVYYFMRNKPGIYEVVLTGTSSNGIIVYPEGTITIIRGDDVVQKYVFSKEEYDNPANSLNGSNTMTWLVDDYASYYINIDINSTGLTSLQLEVRELEIFTLSASDEYSETSSLINGDKFEILDVERTGEYNVQAIYTGSQTDDMLFVILRKNSDGLFEEVDGGLFNNTTNFETDVLLNTGEQIYVGYFNGNGNGTFSLNIERNVSNTFSLMTDPNGNVTVGSEVSLNNGEYGGTTLTQGYTRIVYLGIDAPYIQSRTQYNWYTTDSSVAIVSAYGTVTATASWTDDATYKTVKIRAVYKNDVTIVGEIELTIHKDPNANSTTKKILHYYGMDVRGDGTTGTEVRLNEGSAIEISYMPEVTIGKGYTRYICLGSDSPSNIIQHFNWSIARQPDETGNASVSQYGTITATSEGYITIKGVYKYNTQYEIYIRIKVE